MSFYSHGRQYFAKVLEIAKRPEALQRGESHALAPAPAPARDATQLTIRLAGTAVVEAAGDVAPPADHLMARDLVNRMYGWRGYGNSHKIPLKETHSTFIALVDEHLAGTVTLGVDSESGMAADAIFRDEINEFRRQPGAKVCELTKLAFDVDQPSRQILAALFHIVFLYGRRKHGCTDLFIEVNPRHRRFYQFMLGFEPVGTLKSNQSVQAPAQLMALKVSSIGSQIAKYAGLGDDAKVRSLYPFFLSGQDAAQISDRLASSERYFQDTGRPALDLHKMAL